MVAKTPRRRAASALLVIECDAGRLAAQGLAVGQSICDLIRDFHPRATTQFIQTSTLSELQRSLGNAGQSHGRFRLVILIGHSNEDGIQWTRDQFLTLVASWGMAQLF